MFVMLNRGLGALALSTSQGNPSSSQVIQASAVVLGSLTIAAIASADRGSAFGPLTEDIPRVTYIAGLLASQSGGTFPAASALCDNPRVRHSSAISVLKSAFFLG